MSGVDGHMKYNLPALSEADFTTVHTFVQACFDEGRQRFKPELLTVSKDWRDFPKHFQDELKARQSMGVAMHELGESGKTFHLWMNPSWHLPTQRFYNTLIHELVHGYAGLFYGHSQQWRYWYHRVMWHLNETDIMPNPSKSLHIQCFNVDLNYNKGAGSSWDSVIFAFHAAKRDHDKVLDNYVKRLSIAESAD